MPPQEISNRDKTIMPVKITGIFFCIINRTFLNKLSICGWCDSVNNENYPDTCYNDSNLSQAQGNKLKQAKEQDNG